MKNNINLKSITNSNNDFRNIGSYKVKRQSDVVKMNQESLVQIILKIPYSDYLIDPVKFRLYHRFGILFHLLT